MKRFLLISVLFSILVSCSSTPELETGEIKTLAILGQALKHSNKPKPFVDSRSLLTRKQIDEAKVPVLFVELQSGQGTLTPYPGKVLDKHGWGPMARLLLWMRRLESVQRHGG